MGPPCDQLVLFGPNTLARREGRCGHAWPNTCQGALLHNWRQPNAGRNIPCQGAPFAHHQRSKGGRLAKQPCARIRSGALRHNSTAGMGGGVSVSAARDVRASAQVPREHADIGHRVVPTAPRGLPGTSGGRVRLVTIQANLIRPLGTGWLSQYDAREHVRHECTSFWESERCGM